MQRTTLLTLAALIGLSAIAQNRTKYGYALTWDKEITTGTDSIPNGVMKVPATTFPVYEAEPKDVASLLKTVIPGASFKSKGDVYTALGASVPAVSASPLDLLATFTQNKKGGFTTVALGMLQNGAPLQGDAGFQQALVRNIGVQLNKAVVQRQLDKWTKNSGKAAKEVDSAKKDKDKAAAKVKDAEKSLEKNAASKAKLEKEIANNKADVIRQEERWKVSQDAKSLDKLTKLRGKQLKNETKLSDLLGDQAKMQKSLEQRQRAQPDAEKDQDKSEDAQKEVQRTVDALKQKLESIK